MTRNSISDGLEKKQIKVAEKIFDDVLWEVRTLTYRVHQKKKIRRASGSHRHILHRKTYNMIHILNTSHVDRMSAEAIYASNYLDTHYIVYVLNINDVQKYFTN